MPNIVDSPASTPPADEIASPPSPSRHAGLLVKIETDRRLGHEWDEWNGQPLANGGDFRTTAGKFFLFTAVGLTAIVGHERGSEFFSSRLVSHSSRSGCRERST